MDACVAAPNDHAQAKSTSPCPNRLFCPGESLSLDVTGVKGSGVLVLEGESQCGEYSAPELGCLAK